MPAAKKTTPETIEATSTAVAKATTRSLSEIQPGNLTASLGSDLMAKLGQHAKEVAATEQVKGGAFSFKSGVLSFGGTDMPGNEIEVVILAKAFENTYYDKPYNPNLIANPRCFALQLEDPAEVPMMPNPINEVISPEGCAKCEMFAWGSDPQGSRGKACKERRRLVVMPVDALESVDTVNKADLATMSLPVMSVKNFAKYTNEISAAVGLPLYAVTTRVYLKPDSRSQFTVNFEGVSAIEDPAVLEAVMKKLEAAETMALVPFGAAGEEEEQPQAPAVKRKFKA
jgi:hypothetical protein